MRRDRSSASRRPDRSSAADINEIGIAGKLLDCVLNENEVFVQQFWDDNAESRDLVSANHIGIINKIGVCNKNDPSRSDGLLKSFRNWFFL